LNHACKAPIVQYENGITDNQRMRAVC